MKAMIVVFLKFIMHIVIAGFSLLFMVAFIFDYLSTKHFWLLPAALILLAIALWSLWKISD